MHGDRILESAENRSGVNNIFYRNRVRPDSFCRFIFIFDTGRRPFCRKKKMKIVTKTRIYWRVFAHCLSVTESFGRDVKKKKKILKN